MTQLDKVKQRLDEVGYVDNFWAIDNYILRLGAIILTLKKKHGYSFNSEFGKTLGKDRSLWKNFYYFDATLNGRQPSGMFVDDMKESEAKIISSPEPLVEGEEEVKQPTLW